MATDLQRSVLHTLKSDRQPQPIAYSPYGHSLVESGLTSLLGFNGERPDIITGHYLLGNGYRAFNPVLMRFNSPDSWSPFDRGGLNAYVYCLGDPINKIDPNGRSAIGLLRAYIGRFVMIRGCPVNIRPGVSAKKALRAKKNIKYINKHLAEAESVVNKIFDADSLNNFRDASELPQFGYDRRKFDLKHLSTNAVISDERLHLNDLPRELIKPIQNARDIAKNFYQAVIAKGGVYRGRISELHLDSTQRGLTQRFNLRVSGIEGSISKLIETKRDVIRQNFLTSEDFHNFV